MKKYLWVIGALIGISIGNALWKQSKTYKKHQEEMKRFEEETNEKIKQMVNDAFPKPNFEDQVEAYNREMDAKIEEFKREIRTNY